MCRGGGVYGWGGCDMGRRECIWALLWYSNEHAKTSRQQYIILHGFLIFVYPIRPHDNTAIASYPIQFYKMKFDMIKWGMILKHF